MKEWFKSLCTREHRTIRLRGTNIPPTMQYDYRALKLFHMDEIRNSARNP